jgi:hypothetical protein
MATDHSIPPRLDPLQPTPPPMAGRLGLGLSLIAPATITLMVLLHPG